MGAFSAKLIIETDDPDRPTLQIAIYDRFVNALGLGVRCRLNEATADTEILDGTGFGCHAIAEGVTPGQSPIAGDTLEDGSEVKRGFDLNDAESNCGLPSGVLLVSLTLSYNAITVLPSFNATVINTKDTSVRICIDFEPNSEGEPEVLFESDGGTNGSSIAYEVGNKFIARSAGSVGLVLAVVEHTLTQALLETRFLELIWTLDINDAQGQQSISSWLDRVLVGTDSRGLGVDWPGSNGASFGAASGNFAGAGENGSLIGVEFTSSSIDFDSGLQLYAERLFSNTGGLPPELNSVIITAIVYRVGSV